MTIKYSDLAKKIQALEAQFGGNSTVACKNIPLSLRDIVHQGTETAPCNIPTNGDGNKQYFVLDSGTSKTETDLPVVVTIGVNYSQGANALPHCGIWPAVEQTTNCRKSVENQIKSAWRNDGENWSKTGFRAAVFSEIQEADFHLVITNFSLWISKVKYGSLSHMDGAKLLHDYDLGSNAVSFGQWQHLAKLKESLESHIVHWVGHTLDSPLPLLFYSFLRSHNITRNWILTGNLSWRPWSPKS